MNSFTNAFKCSLHGINALSVVKLKMFLYCLANRLVGCAMTFMRTWNIGGAFLVGTLAIIGSPELATAQVAYIAEDIGAAVTAVDVQTNSILANISVAPFHPQNVAISPSGAVVYAVACCDGSGKGAVLVIRTDTNTLQTTITLPGASSPYGIAINSTGSMLYVTDFYGVNPHEVFAISTATNTIVATISVGPFPHSVVFAPGGATAYVANSIDNDNPSLPLSNTVSVIATGTGSVVANIPVGTRPHALAINPSGSLLYVTNYDDGTVSAISTATNTVVAVIPLSVNAIEGVVFSRNGAFAYVCHQHSNFISVIDTIASAVVGTITVGQQPFGLALTPDGQHLYVANQVSGDVSIVDTTTNTVVATLPMPSGSSPVNVGITLITATPTAQIQNLIQSTLITNLGASIQSQLDSKLSAALATLDAAHANSATTAANQLQAFANAVKADVQGGKITCAQASALVQAAQQIVAALGQPPLSVALPCP